MVALQWQHRAGPALSLVPGSAGNPPPTAGAVGWWDEERGLLMMLGGYVKEQLVMGDESSVRKGGTSALWAFNISSEQWLHVNGAPSFEAASSSPTTPADTAATPGPRFSMTTWWNSAARRLWLFGGVSVEGSAPHADLWYLDFMHGPTPTWVRAAVAGSGPGARRLAMGWSAHGGRSLLLFGGYSKEGWRNDLWQLDTSSSPLRWLRRGGSAAGNPAGSVAWPAARTSGATWSTQDVSGADILWMSGGYAGFAPLGGWLDDMWALDLPSMRWRRLPGQDKINVLSSSVPGSRDRAAAWVERAPSAARGRQACAKLWLFGGSGFGAANATRKADKFAYLSDAWRFDACNGAWQLASASQERGAYSGTVPQHPGGRTGAVSWSTQRVVGHARRTEFWLFGGHGYDADDKFERLSDLWSAEGGFYAAPEPLVASAAPQRVAVAAAAAAAAVRHSGAALAPAHTAGPFVVLALLLAFAAFWHAVTRGTASSIGNGAYDHAAAEVMPLVRIGVLAESRSFEVGDGGTAFKEFSSSD